MTDIVLLMISAHAVLKEVFGCRYPNMKEAASRQSDHLQGTSGGDDKAYSRLAEESGPHQDKSRPPPGPHDVSG